MLLLLFEERQIFSVAFFLQFFHRNEAQRGRIDAITLTCRSRPVGENVAEVRIAFARTHFGAVHAESAIGFLRYARLVDWLGKTGPAAAAVELVARTEERFAAHNIDINSVAVLVP